jgi:hypothetical protein
LETNKYRVVRLLSIFRLERKSINRKISVIISCVHRNELTAHADAEIAS